jgi:uncharacterized protein with HEPN domain
VSTISVGFRSSDIEEALRAAHRDVPWAEIVGMRNVLVHEYFGVDVEEIWTTIQHDLPRLKPKLAAILAELPPGS